MRQFQMGWNPLWAWVCFVFDSQDVLNDLLDYACDLRGGESNHHALPAGTPPQQILN